MSIPAVVGKRNQGVNEPTQRAAPESGVTDVGATGKRVATDVR